MKLKLFAVLAFASVLSNFARSEPVDIWLSSQSDVRYYTEMLDLYRRTVDKDFEGELHFFGFRELPDKLAVSIKTKTNTPDIVQLDEVFFGMYLRDGMPFLDITDRAKAAGLDRDLLPQRLALFQKGDRIHGLPQSLGATVMYYRRDLFELFDIEVSDLQTWQDVERIMGPLAESGQSFMAVDPSLFEIILRQRGSDLVSMNNEPLPDFDMAVETLEWIVDITKRRIGLEPDRASVYDPAFFSTDVANNEIMAIVGADWYGLDMIQSFSQDLKGKWGIMPLPAWADKETGKLSGRLSCFAGQGLLIYEGSKQIEEAWKFIEFVMTNKEANVARFLSGNSFPAYKPVFADKRLHEPNAFFGGDSLGDIFADRAESIPYVGVSYLRPMAVFMTREGMISSVMHEQMTAEEALAKMRDQLRATAPH